MRLLLSTKVVCATGGEYLSHELFEKGASSMGPNDWILIVDDEKTRRHELSIILEFLGESITGTDSATWQKAAEEAGPADCVAVFLGSCGTLEVLTEQDRKSTRLNSSHVAISYAVFCLKKKKKTQHN